MVSRALSSIAFLLVVVFLITLISAVMLGIGTSLTLLFAVSVWEATVVVMVVTVSTYWLTFHSGRHDHWDEEYLDEELDDERPPRITVADFVVRPNRRSRRRKR
jgi:hypothetical protein